MKQDLTFKKFQKECKQWGRKNFGKQDPILMFLGVAEEVGELAHALLKSKQGIRVNQDHETAKKDAVGDTIVYLAQFCNESGLDLQEIVETTWAGVKKRNWKRNKIDGGA